ncbi:DUF7146 domain-containing protein [Asticcacaulis endophyticus]|uniref:DNA primase n=1 Tax=Asticcacaulis endophyticus TaxID=1395890 RepID=A0A918Q6L4_9CAUL|nr:toprim domain-containing protein [Asticcacaulis endophyticus]GGZ32741.1 DNA primase [Asticcacaulis endophyticus]
MTMGASEIAYRLGQVAWAVCRHYLSNGHQEGRYWRVGDARNTAGQSMFVRLADDLRGQRAGKWQDAATGEHGDLLDIIRETCGLTTFVEVLAEGRRFLSMPPPAPDLSLPGTSTGISRVQGSPEAARRLVAASQPIAGTLAETYLLGRGIRLSGDTSMLRFHPRCYYGGKDGTSRKSWPALIAASANDNGEITGAHRTYLDPDGWHPIRLGKAPVASPKKSIGEIYGHGIRIGRVEDVMAVGEGLETVASLRTVLPGMPVIATLSASHLAALTLPLTLQRLYIVRDNDAAGYAATERLAARADDLGIRPIVLPPQLDDLNTDLRLLGVEQLRRQLLSHIVTHDAYRSLR